MHCRRLAGSIAVGITLAGCGEPSGKDVTSRPRQREPEVPLAAALSPALLATVNPIGELPVGNAANEPGIEIGGERAIVLALAVAREFGPYHRDVVERAVGQPVQFDALEAEPRVFLARSAYGELDARYARPKQKHLGAHYIVTLSQKGVPVLSVSVSARASDVQLRNRRIVMPRRYGNEFRMLPIAGGLEYPIRPERAARLASQLTGARVAEPPVLVAPAAGTFTPHYARWRLVLDRPVATASNSRSDTVYVDWSGRAQTPAFRDRRPDIASVRLASKAEVRERIVLPARAGYGRHFIDLPSERRIP